MSFIEELTFRLRNVLNATGKIQVQPSINRASFVHTINGVTVRVTVDVIDAKD